MLNKRFWNISLIVFIGLMLTASAGFAKVSPEEAARLGKDLTYLGAERAGNADGTIPAWEGGLSYETTPDLPKLKLGQMRPNPFKGEKTLFTITAQNAKDYADKLTPGQLALFKKYPEWRMNIYPSHRTTTNPKRIREAIVKNATTAELSEDGLYPVNPSGGSPFPIPNNGNEAILNHLYGYMYDNCATLAPTYFVLKDGTIVNNGTGNYKAIVPYQTQGANAPNLWTAFIDYTTPPRRKGEIIMLHYTMRMDTRIWTYVPGQRRVRRAPSLTYDTPDPSAGNLATYDDVFMYNGKIDRFDWKLVGKKELYIMYNNYDADKCAKEDLLTASYLNPDIIRWELHRVWVVEATLKEGKRHVYGKRIMYMDEDSWFISIHEKYDNRGNLWRTSFSSHAMLYDYGMPNTRIWCHQDLTSDTYVAGSVSAGMPDGTHPIYNQPGLVAEETFTPEYLRRAGQR